MLFVLAFTALAQVIVLGPVLHESDQASLLNGSLQIGSEPERALAGAEFYNYSRQYLSYLSLALLFRALPDTTDPVTAANIVNWLVFYSGLACLVLARPPRSLGSFFAAACCLLSPSLWQHSGFVASNFLSCGVLLFGSALWSRSGLRRRAAILTVCLAPGFRADILLVLPLVVWTLEPRRTARGWFCNPTLWIVGMGGAASVSLGHVLAGSFTADSYPPFFIPKVFAAYTVFGLGSSAVLLVLIVVAVTTGALRSRRPWSAAHRLLGVAAWVPAIAFYSVQMFTTRHWTVIIAVLTIFTLSARGQALLNSARLTALTGLTFVSLGVVPLFLGIRLPDPASPRLVVGPGTAFPTTDGDLTMGGFILRLIAMRASSFLHDHNQALWLAASHTNFTPDASGRIPLFPTPLVPFSELAVTLQGKRSTRLQPDEFATANYYVDSRFLTRASLLLGTNADAGAGATDLMTRKVSAVSPEFGGIRMLLSQLGEPSPEFQRVKVLAQAFGGNEFRLIDLTTADLDQWEGHTFVVSRSLNSPGTDPVRASFAADLDKVPPDGDFTLILPWAILRDSQARVRMLARRPGVEVAVSRYPAYMDVRVLR